jgi:hypothetical protein
VAVRHTARLDNVTPVQSIDLSDTKVANLGLLQDPPGRRFDGLPRLVSQPEHDRFPTYWIKKGSLLMNAGSFLDPPQGAAFP